MKLYGIEILLERMKTHPEEFTADGKWTDLLVKVDRHLTEEEREAVKQGFTNMARATFNEVVMKGIANEPVEYDQVQSIAQDYDSVMSYPLERMKAHEREKKEQYQRDIELEKMRIGQQHAMQGLGGYNAAGMGGLMGNQARGY